MNIRLQYTPSRRTQWSPGAPLTSRRRRCFRMARPGLLPLVDEDEVVAELRLNGALHHADLAPAAGVASAFVAEDHRVESGDHLPIRSGK